jgi:predicted patatin/cPLA2 family phospholipase
LGLLSRLALARYPGIRRVLSERGLNYNASLDRVDTLEQAGEAFVLRPVAPLVVGRMERDAAKLDTLYRQGYDETLERLPSLRAWL